MCRTIDEPEAQAAVRARGGGVALAEPIEHVRQHVRRDALAAVGDRDPRVRPRASGGDDDAAPRAA